MHYIMQLPLTVCLAAFFIFGQGHRPAREDDDQQLNVDSNSSARGTPMKPEDQNCLKVLRKYAGILNIIPDDVESALDTFLKADEALQKVKPLDWMMGKGKTQQDERDQAVAALRAKGFNVLQAAGHCKGERESVLTVPCTNTLQDLKDADLQDLMQKGKDLEMKKSMLEVMQPDGKGLNALWSDKENEIWADIIEKEKELKSEVAQTEIKSTNGWHAVAMLTPRHWKLKATQRNIQSGARKSIIAADEKLKEISQKVGEARDDLVTGKTLKAVQEAVEKFKGNTEAIKEAGQEADEQAKAEMDKDKSDEGVAEYEAKEAKIQDVEAQKENEALKALGDATKEIGKGVMQGLQDLGNQMKAGTDNINQAIRDAGGVDKLAAQKIGETVQAGKEVVDKAKAALDKENNWHYFIDGVHCNMKDELFVAQKDEQHEN